MRVLATVCVLLDKRAWAVAGKSNTDNTAAPTMAVAISELMPALVTPMFVMATTSGKAVPQ